MSSMVWFLIIVAVLVAFIGFIVAAGKSKSEDKSEKYTPTKYKPPVRNIPSQQQIENIPIMTNHASQRMAERLGVAGYKQTELMNNAFKYGKTSDRTMGDLRAKLESAEQNYDEETVAKFYGNSIYIFTVEDNILKTVYPFDDSNNIYHWKMYKFDLKYL